MTQLEYARKGIITDKMKTAALAEGVDAEFIRAGSYTIDIAGTRYPADAYLRSPYDPGRARILA